MGRWSGAYYAPLGLLMTDDSWQTILFDLDGTLTNNAVGITRCIQHALGSLDEPVPAADALHWCIGPPLRDSFVTLLDEARADRGLALYRERYADVGIFENEVYPEIEALLTALRDGRKDLFVATSKPAVFAERICERFFGAGAFDGVFGSGLDGTLADKAELISFVRQRTGFDPRRSVMVGDRRHDVVGARANGIVAVGALWGFGSPKELREARADHLIEQPLHFLTL